ncbi:MULTISPECIES: hypothetical protein [unclassified Endozoicomonas]|uniref:hypothetical protein n=1 Tax=unclassified Endozoicomonas TaxID=2644528 RepID=UPI003BB4BAA3
MTYGVTTTTTSTATGAVFQPSQNSAPESKAKTDTVPSIPPAGHPKTGTSLTDRKAEAFLLNLQSNKTKVDKDDTALAQCYQRMVNEAMTENQKLVGPFHELMLNVHGIYTYSDSEISKDDEAIAQAVWNAAKELDIEVKSKLERLKDK